MKDKDFERYVKHQLSSMEYDADGLSSCAVMASRRKGMFSLWLKSSKQLCKDVSSFMNEFDGMETPVNWFVMLLLVPFVFIISLFTRPWYMYNKSYAHFKRQYLIDINTGKWAKEE